MAETIDFAEAPAVSAPLSSSPIPEAFAPEGLPEAPSKSELEKSYNVTDPSEVREVEPEPTKSAETTSEEPAKAEETPAKTEGEDADPALLARAAALGIEEEEALDLGSNARLQRYVERLERTALQTAVKPAAPAAAPEPEFKIDLDPKEYDEKVVKTLNDMNAYHAKKLAELQARFQATEGFFQQQRDAHATVALDAAFAGLQHVKEFVGDKPMSQLGANSEQGKTRLAIVNQAKILMDGLSANGQKVPETSVLLSQAAQIVLGDKLKKIATEDVRAKVTERQSQFIKRASSMDTGNEAKTPEDRAKAKVAEMIKLRGLD